MTIVFNRSTFHSQDDTFVFEVNWPVPFKRRLGVRLAEHSIYFLQFYTLFFFFLLHLHFQEMSLKNRFNSILDLLHRRIILFFLVLTSFTKNPL